MDKGWILLLLIFVPLTGSAFLPLLGRANRLLRNIVALGFVVFSFLLCALLVPSIMAGETIRLSWLLPLGFNFVLTADGLAVFMGLVSSFISSLILLYSFGYISHYKHQNEYYLMVVLFLGSMMGLVFSGNLILLYVFWELTALTSWRLIGFFRNKEVVWRANKAFLMTVGGALVMLLGFFLLYQETGTFDLAVLKGILQSRPVSDAAVALILVGLFSKSATLPFQTWLPDAGVAPAPVTALLHAAVLVKIGVYVFARIFVATIPLDVLWQTLVPLVAGFSALIAGCAALMETDLKRIIAYSTISQISFIFLGLTTGSPMGLAGALLFILMHGLAKAGLFLSAGIIEQNTKTKDIMQMGGLAQTMPVTAAAFLFCAFSVMGIPPFGGFFSKYMILAAALQSGHYGIAALFFAGAVLTILYLLRVFHLVFMGPLKTPGTEGSRIMVFCVALFAALSLVSGFLIRYPDMMVRLIVQPWTGLS